MSFQLVPKSVTLIDLERRNGRYFALFSEFGYSFGAQGVKVHVRYLISWWFLVSLCQLTCLTIHNSLSLSLPAQDLPLSQTFWPQDWLHVLYYWPFVLSISVFVFSFFITLSWFGLVPCGRLSWLFVSFWAHVNIPCSASIISYHNILNQSYSIWRLTPITTSNAQTADAAWRAAFGQLILRKIVKNIATRCQILRPKMHQKSNSAACGSAPDSAGPGNLQRSPRSPILE